MLIAMSDGDPFGTSGYARVDQRGQLQPVSPEELQRLATTQLAYFAERDHAADADHCFLCGVGLSDPNRSKEHVFPQWLLRECDLWREKITLLNGTTIPYASLTIPACTDCNSFWLSGVESQVAEAFRAGPEAVRGLDQTTLALWIAKLYYGLHFKEIGLATDRRDPAGPRILSSEHLRDNLGGLHQLMQALRGRARFTRPLGSVIVLRTQVPEPPRLRFDYRDSFSVPFLAVRIGASGVLASLLDWGAVSDGLTINSVEMARRLDLHPQQFREAAAAFAYAASRFDGEFIYSIKPQGDHDLVEPVLVKPAGEHHSLFLPFNPREAAEVQAAFMGLDLEDIYDPAKDGVWTCLHDADGRPASMPLERFPLDMELITPLRAAREAAEAGPSDANGAGDLPRTPPS